MTARWTTGLGPLPEWAAPVVIAAKAAGAVPDGMLAVEMAADEHAQARTASASRLLGELQGELLGGDDIVAADDALMFHAEDLLEIHATQPHEGGRALGRGAAEFGIERRDELLPQVAVRRRNGRDAGDAQLIDQATLQGAIGPFAAAARLGGVAQDVFDAQPRQRPAHLR